MRHGVLMTGLVLLGACQERGTPRPNTPSSTGPPRAENGAVETCLLTLRPTQGDKFTYDLAMGAGRTAQGRTAQVIISIRMLTESVERDRITFLTSVERMHAQGRPLPEEALAEVKRIRTRTVMDSTGKWISSSSEGLPPGQAEPNTAFGVSFPSGPVRLGDMWEGTSTHEGKQIPVRCKLVRFDTLDGAKVAVVEAAASGDLGLSVSWDGPVTYAIELATGMLFMASMTLKSAEDGAPMWAEVRRT